MQGNIDLLRAFLKALKRDTPDISRKELEEEAACMGATLGLNAAQIQQVLKEVLR